MEMQSVTRKGRSRRDKEVRVLQENAEQSSSGCEARPTKPARHVGSEPCDGHEWERAEAGRRRVRRYVGARTSEPREVSLENPCLFRVPKAFSCLKATASCIPDGTRLDDALGGVSVRGALEEDDPETWETHALGWAPEAESKGDQSSGLHAQWESEGPVVAMKWGNE
jgi:hypothetical protein